MTGGNRGLGYEICRQLGQLGYRVFLAARDADRGEAAAEQLRGLDVDAYPVVLDVADAVSVEQAARSIADEISALDVLVNNAGTFEEEWGTPPSELSAQEIQQTFNTNVYGPLAVIQAFLPLLRHSPAARIVNISSDMGSLSNINNPESHVYSVVGPAYQASKAALNAITVLFAKELGPLGMKVNSASPGWCQTDMGTADAPLTVPEGAETPVWLATLPQDGPNGGFFSSSRKRGQMEW